MPGTPPPLASDAQPLAMCAHVVRHHSSPVKVSLVGHRDMVYGGPTNSPHLPGVDLV